MTDHDLLDAIRDEMVRTGFGHLLPIRIGARRGRVFAGILIDVEAVGDTIGEALAGLLAELKGRADRHG